MFKAHQDYYKYFNLFSLGWSFEEVLPFFKISEDNRDYSFAKDSIHHAVGGPQPVSQPKFITPLGKAFLVKNYLVSIVMKLKNI